MSEHPNGSQTARGRQELPQRDHIMLHEAFAIFWSLYVLYRFMEISTDEPMNHLEYYTQ